MNHKTLNMGIPRESASAQIGIKSAFGSTEKRSTERRIPSAGSVRIDSRDYPLVNWSATGVLIGGHKDHLAKGQRFRMQVEVTDEAEMIAFSCEGIVLRTQGEKLAAQFLSIDKNVKARIHKFFGRKGSGL